MASLAAATLRAPLAADVLVDAIFSRGSGHPLFTQELARAMSQEEPLEIDDSGTIGPRARVNLDEVSFPESLEGIIGHRLDHLPPDDQLTLKVASVIGQSFTLDALAAIHPDGHDAARLGEHIDDLRDYELVTGDGDDYQFIHALTRDAA